MCHFSINWNKEKKANITSEIQLECVQYESIQFEKQIIHIAPRRVPHASHIAPTVANELLFFIIIMMISI